MQTTITQQSVGLLCPLPVSFLALRLGLFQAGLGMLAVLTLGIFNRLLIEEFSVPAALTALAIGAQQLVAFTRVWFGRQSDRMPKGSLRRTPWILGGAAAFCTLFWVAGRLVLWIAEASSAGDTGLVVQRGLLLTLVFLLYGTAVSASSTPFAALLIDVTTERQRPQLVSIVWTMLTWGLLRGDPLEPFSGISLRIEQLDLVIQGVERLIVVAPVLIFSLVLISIIGVERLHSSREGRDGGSQELSVRQTIQVIRADRQGYFFGVLCLFTFSSSYRRPSWSPTAAPSSE